MHETFSALVSNFEGVVKKRNEARKRGHKSRGCRPESKLLVFAAGALPPHILCARTATDADDLKNFKIERPTSPMLFAR
jgi:hypothetical protein